MTEHKIGDLVYQLDNKSIGIITKITDDDKESMPRYRMIYIIEYANGKTGRHSAAVIDGMKSNLQNHLRKENGSQSR
jgi:hypothetical protein